LLLLRFFKLRRLLFDMALRAITQHPMRYFRRPDDAVGGRANCNRGAMAGQATGGRKLVNRVGDYRWRAIECTATSPRDEHLV
jgi:hypothetical protein